MLPFSTPCTNIWWGRLLLVIRLLDERREDGRGWYYGWTRSFDQALDFYGNQGTSGVGYKRKRALRVDQKRKWLCSLRDKYPTDLSLHYLQYAEYGLKFLHVFCVVVKELIDTSLAISGLTQRV